MSLVLKKRYQALSWVITSSRRSLSGNALFPTQGDPFNGRDIVFVDFSKHKVHAILVEPGLPWV